MKIMSALGRLSVAGSGEIDEPVEKLIEKFFDPGLKN
jgi:hypothetical protein